MEYKRIIAQAHQTKHENLTKLQDNVVNRLRTQYEKLGGNVPSNVYSKIEDEAVQATKPKKIVDGLNIGGGGLTRRPSEESLW